MATTPSASGDIITAVRYQLQDVFADNYRWSTPELLLYIAEGVRAIIRVHSQAYCSTSGVQHTSISIPDPGALSASTVKVRVTPSYNQALINWVCYRALSKEEGQNAVGESRIYFDQFRSALGLPVQAA